MLFKNKSLNNNVRQVLNIQSIEPRALVSFKQFLCIRTLTPKKNSKPRKTITDGMSDDQRKNRFLGVPLYEKVQVHVYMLLTGTTHSVLTTFPRNRIRQLILERNSHT